MTTSYPVSVTVDAEGKIDCSPNPVVVTTPDALISFTLLTPGYAFPGAEAAVVRKPSETFPYPSWTVQSSLAALVDLNDVAGDFQYTLNVVEVASGKSLRHDPGIRNQP